MGGLRGKQSLADLPLPTTSIGCYVVSQLLCLVLEGGGSLTIRPWASAEVDTLRREAKHTTLFALTSGERGQLLSSVALSGGGKTCIGRSGQDSLHDIHVSCSRCAVSILARVIYRSRKACGRFCCRAMQVCATVDKYELRSIERHGGILSPRQELLFL